VHNNWQFVLLACLTIGLAPFFPEPHIWGKLLWVMGGAKGMQLIDWLDLLMHGLPWILLIRLIGLTITRRFLASNAQAKAK
jgi:hypothetical protein